MLGMIRRYEQTRYTLTKRNNLSELSLLTGCYPAGQLKQDAVRDQQLRTEVDKAVFHFPPVVCHVTVTSGHCQVT